MEETFWSRKVGNQQEAEKQDWRSHLGKQQHRVGRREQKALEPNPSTS